MFRKALLICMLLMSAVFAGSALAAGDPSLHEVYQAAEAGRLNDALGMMNQVLRDHPNSGKAHFVEAELLAKQGRLTNAASELQTAERLAPGLPFANAQAVDSLRRHISPSSSSARMITSAYGTQSSPTSQFPMGLLLVGAALIAAIIFFARKLSQRNANVMQATGGPGLGNGNGFGSGAPMQSGGAGGGMGMAPMGQAAGGMGSGILGGLATGAALGAGMVAGEALMHRFTDGGRQHDTGQSSYIPASYDRDASTGDLGGDDFGVSDGGSWDDSSSGGGGDWS